FVVEKDGTLTNPRVVRDIGGGCGEEALRVVKMMPKWKPGEQFGEIVIVQYTLPILFELNKSHF
ncbi:MAG: energy transducer TonB, partial [Bacteroidales bacterium]|nr:energy transducer TonB [Bacteroidales bacterium]